MSNSVTQTAIRFFASPPQPRRFRWWSTLALWRERRRTREHLSILDDRLLADIGLTRVQQRRECAKAFWQL